MGNNPEINKLKFRIPYEFEKINFLTNLHLQTGHNGYHCLYEAIRDKNIFFGFFDKWLQRICK